jgi:hypothetical protein
MLSYFSFCIFTGIFILAGNRRESRWWQDHDDGRDGESFHAQVGVV